ncbi:MAG: hypothetical protein HOC70_01225 [Gammaproteobacteria bacterium]|jgi:hypothetical protein|nr:hypothetical protein [Gammaproteobacteria bacterium]MBT7370521.1 hypothetical protein [Gammaproteobacteria bacterium]
MITRPAIGKILNAIARDLEAEVLPAIEDPKVKVTVQMMAQLLEAMSRRDEREVDIIVQESTEVMALAKKVSREHQSAANLTLAIQNCSASTHLDRNYYEALSEVLSCLAEVIVSEGSAAEREALQLLFSQRIANEVSIIGEDFKPIGRA